MQDINIDVAVAHYAKALVHCQQLSMIGIRRDVERTRRGASRFNEDLDERPESTTRTEPITRPMVDTGALFRHMNPFATHHDDEPIDLSSDSSEEVITDASEDEGEHMPVLQSCVGEGLKNEQDQFIFYSSTNGPTAKRFHDYFESFTPTSRGRRPAHWLDFKIHADPSCPYVMQHWDTMSIKCVKSEYKDCQV